MMTLKQIWIQIFGLICTYTALRYITRKLIDNYLMYQNVLRLRLSTDLSIGSMLSYYVLRIYQIENMFLLISWSAKSGNVLRPVK
jgi:hypothetical protein